MAGDHRRFGEGGPDGAWMGRSVLDFSFSFAPSAKASLEAAAARFLSARSAKNPLRDSDLAGIGGFDSSSTGDKGDCGLVIILDSVAGSELVTFWGLFKGSWIAGFLELDHGSGLVIVIGLVTEDGLATGFLFPVI